MYSLYSYNLKIIERLDLLVIWILRHKDDSNTFTNENYENIIYFFHLSLSPLSS